METQEEYEQRIIAENILIDKQNQKITAKNEELLKCRLEKLGYFLILDKVLNKIDINSMSSRKQINALNRFKNKDYDIKNYSHREVLKKELKNGKLNAFGLENLHSYLKNAAIKKINNLKKFKNLKPQGTKKTIEKIPTTITVDYDFFKEKNINLGRVYWDFDTQYYPTSRQYPAISCITFSSYFQSDFNQLEQSIIDEKETSIKRAIKRNKKRDKLIETFEGLLKNMDINYRKNWDMAHNSCYFSSWDLALEYRFSNHKKGNSHWRFNGYTGEREFIEYDAYYVTSLEKVKECIEGIKTELSELSELTSTVRPSM